MEHFLSIAQAVQRFGSQNASLWDDEDGFFYDVLVRPDGSYQPLRVRSLVGLLPLLAVAAPPQHVLDELPDFAARLAWLTEAPAGAARWAAAPIGPRRPASAAVARRPGPHGADLVAHVRRGEFFSPFGIRSLSAAYRDGYTTAVDGASMTIDYEPGESPQRPVRRQFELAGPIWMPVNVLLADALRMYGHYLR